MGKGLGGGPGRRCLRVFAAALFVVAAGCGTRMAITPKVPGGDVAGFTVKGQIAYEGNPDYLPRTIAPGSPGESGFSFRYAYQCTYGMDNTHQALPLFNPLSLVGFPIGANTVVVAGKLDVYRGDVLARSYTATCALDKTRNLFYEGETYSEMRKRGLAEVRANIELQMHADREFFSNPDVKK